MNSKIEGWTKDHTQVYLHGDECTIGEEKVERSAEIEFRCGEKPTIIEVVEAQTCVYNIVMETPCVCNKQSTAKLNKEKARLESLLKK